MRGFTAHDNAMKIRALSIHYSADPDKDPGNPEPEKAAKAREWLETQRVRWPDPNDFAREFELSWYSGIGTRVFPQFTKTNHCARLEINRRKVIYRGWDFGWHAPVCLFAQIDQKDRLLLLREVVGNQQSTSDFAKHVIQRSAEWFPMHAAGYDDFCDPAGQQIKSMENEKNERRDTEVLAGLGIHAKYAWGWNRKDGRSLVHQLLTLRSDGTPSLYVDDAGCPLLAQSFLGRYVYPESQDGTVKDEPDDKTHPWADVQAALRYLVIGLHPKLGVARFEMGRAQNFVDMSPSHHGYGSPRRR